MRDWEMFKCFARTWTIALLARPLTGGSFTETINSVSENFSTFSSFELGFALTDILIFLFSQSGQC